MTYLALVLSLAPCQGENNPHSSSISPSFSRSLCVYVSTRVCVFFFSFFLCVVVRVAAVVVAECVHVCARVPVCAQMYIMCVRVKLFSFL